VSDPRATTAVVQAVQWSPDGALRIVDQRRLPGAFVERDLRTVSEVADAIRSLAVRGAPAIGIAAAMGLVASLREAIRTGAVARSTVALADLRAGAEMLRATRPTAVNLGWAIDRMLAVAARSAEGEPAAMLETLHDEAEAIRAEDAAMCQAMGAHGVALLRDGIRVLTHCNAGALATAGIGTALAPIYVAHAAGVKVAVVACETRPLLQGARLTAWELRQAGVPVTLIADSMAASVMAAGRVDLVLVGADRIAANGDTANKIGTLALAVLAQQYGIPFVVVAPTSTVDVRTPTGAEIPIEERSSEELTHLGGERVAAPDVVAFNPAFDVTPATLITHIVTERGILVPPLQFDGLPITPPPV
jgi:methylthioribose-1-phosphate isomerase